MADPKYVQDFIAEMTPFAVAIGDQYGIDPVTIITQAAVETGWGREVAGNNYFGVKSHGQPGGQNITTHEEVNGKRVRTTDNFRTYGSLGESVADYGRFLSENPRYAEALKQTGPGELQGIAAAGYATDSNYADLTRNVAGMVQRNIKPLPPGSLPEVATALSTVPTPPPSLPLPPKRLDLVARSFANLPKPSSANLGDNLAMSPVQGGAQKAPMFDAGFDERLGAMRTFPAPMDTQGMFTARSPAPPPVPAQMSPQMAGRRATDPVLQAALNARYPAPRSAASLSSIYAGGGPTRPPTDQVGIAPTGRPMLDNGDGSVSTELSITVTDPRLNNGQPTNIPTIWGGRRLNDAMAINSALASGQKFTAFPSISAAERAAEYRSANEILPRPPVSASDMARGRSGISTVATYPTTGVGQPPSTRTVASVPMPPRPSVPSGGLAGMERAPNIPDRLTPGLPGMPALYGDFSPQQVAQIGVPAFPDPMQPRTRVASAAPFPMPRPNFMPQVGTQLAVTPPAMPSRRAPVPMPFAMRPQQQPSRTPLRITVNGANPLPAPPQQSSAVQQFRNQGMSAAQAYDAANRAAAERARDRSGNSSPERSDYFKMATGG